ncbi:hypothetical protein AI2602V1_3509 [Citrobacter freundii]|uniref:hypothetical protein n=1 Tax=Citrobacter freundii TaxID=546 RepID=UPI001DAE45BB|nr:hypothetical protein [Citrobacter freundii]CAE6158611.1 hypothetical protein AI2602V1_3509 [Citrobacter freundii]CAH3350570.1 hypothetical protein AI2602V1_3509 [Citrobacter freundii]CAH5962153.1 hypothetical protein AI3058V1_0685 [Citrobacter freundii]HBK3068581.1 hypothetical protein [Citrobacter freundii]
MTTNNHPAHGPVSLDRLHQISEILSKAAAQSDGGNLGYAMADAVKVIDGVIAAFGNEPVTVNDDMAYAFHHALSDSSLGSDEVEEIKAGLRAAFANVSSQPAPVVPDEIEPDDSNTFDYVDGWNACRAAMLQAGNHTEQRLDMVEHSGDANENVDCRLPFEQWLSQQNEPIDVDCGCVTIPVIPDDWQLVPKKITLEMECAISRADSYEIGWEWALAAAPKNEVK